MCLLRPRGAVRLVRGGLSTLQQAQGGPRLFAHGGAGGLDLTTDGHHHPGDQPHLHHLHHRLGRWSGYRHRVHHRRELGVVGHNTCPWCGLTVKRHHEGLDIQRYPSHNLEKKRGSFSHLRKL